MFEKIFQPITINSVTIKNRLVVPPMVSNFARNDGTVTDTAINYYEARAKGGFGLIVVEALAVHLLGRGYEFGFGIWDDKHISGCTRLTEAVHKGGAKVFAQLIHAGAQTTPAVLGTMPVAPTAMLHPGYNVLTRELTKDEIVELIDAFGQSARRAKEAGFDGVEIHGSHGYLLSQFMSQFTNRRSDEYGGSLANRLRVPIEILKSIRSYCGNDFPVTIRIAGDERVSEGRKIDETKVAIKLLDEAGYDGFHVTSATTASTGFVAPPSYVEPAFNVGFAEKIKKITAKPIITTGRIHDPYLAEMILAEDRADMIGMGRSSIADPELPNKVMRGELDEICPCVACLQGCIGHLYTNTPISCLANPFVGREGEIKIEPAQRAKKILVAGGGPAGLEAAKTLALRGHKVDLYEKTEKLGGQLVLACMPPHKQSIAQLLQYYIKKAKDAGVNIHLQQPVTKELVKEANPDLVVIATGGEAIVPNIPGKELMRSETAWDILAGKVTLGPKVLVVGGGSVGCEVADFLTAQGRQVTLVEMKHDIGADMVKRVRQFLLQRLDSSHVDVQTDNKVCEIRPDGALVCHVNAEEGKALAGYDGIVWALGTKPDTALAKELEGTTYEVVQVGDCVTIADALAAIQDAQAIGLKY